MSPTWSKPTRYLVAVGLVLFGVYVLYLSRPVLPLLSVAAVLSFLAQPIIGLLHQRLRLPRPLAVLLTYLFGLFCLGLALFFIIPEVIGAVRFVLELDYGVLLERLTAATRGWLQQLQAAEFPFEPIDRAVNDAATAMLDSFEGVAPLAPDGTALDVAAIVQQLGSAVVVSFNLLSGLVGTLLSQLLTGVFVLLMSIYISMDAHRLKGWFLRIVPDLYQPEMVTLLGRVQRVWLLFLRGQVSLMVLIGIVVWLGLSLLGLPYALILGIVAGLLEIVPNLGPIVATIPAVLIALLEGSSVLDISPLAFALVIVLFYIVVQQLENNIIVPRLLGNAVDLHAVIVMGGILAGASIGGVLGALLAVPVIATAKEILTYLYAKVLGQDPFPADGSEASAGNRKSVTVAVGAMLASLRERIRVQGQTRDSAALTSSVEPPAAFQQPSDED